MKLGCMVNKFVMFNVIKDISPIVIVEVNQNITNNVWMVMTPSMISGICFKIKHNYENRL
jgi:hypothetical protein